MGVSVIRMMIVSVARSGRLVMVIRGKSNLLAASPRGSYACKKHQETTIDDNQPFHLQRCYLALRRMFFQARRIDAIRTVPACSIDRLWHIQPLISSWLEFAGQISLAGESRVLRQSQPYELFRKHQGPAR